MNKKGQRGEVEGGLESEKWDGYGSEGEWGEERVVEGDKEDITKKKKKKKKKT